MAEKKHILIRNLTEEEYRILRMMKAETNARSWDDFIRKVLLSKKSV